ncbi:hypothetical protein HYS93_01500 [Candidatus Daviesbacteria bacterium]|nr:hypothetical protein [Candidatus Daviesbacteria bacterium]
MPILKKQQGIIPLFVLIAIGIALLVGGTYIIRNEFIKTGKSGKSAIDEKKVKQQIANPLALPSLSPSPKIELAQSRYTYEPQKLGQDVKAPKFTINPPSAWNKRSATQGNEVVTFEAPEEDKEEAEDNLVVRLKPVVSVYLAKSPQSGTLDDLMKVAKSSSEKTFEKVEYLADTKTKFAGLDSVFIEAKALKQGVTIHTNDYYLVKDSYWVHVAGSSLDSTWSKWSGVIKASMNSFTFVE